MRRHRPIIAALATLVAFVALFTRGFIDFDRLRLKLVQSATAATQGSVRLTSDQLDGLTGLHQPLALIAQIDNPTHADHDFTLSVDGAPVCRPHVGAGTTRRVDCVATAWAAGSAHEIRFDGPPDGWALTYLEIATHHGNTSGPFFFVILPRDSAHYTPVSPAFSLLAALAIGALFLLIDPAPFARWLALTHRALSFVVAATLAVIAAAPWVSHYRVIVWSWTVIAFLVVLALPQAWTATRWLFGRHASAAGRWVDASRRFIVAAIVAGIFATAMHVRLAEAYDGNYSGFLTVSRSSFDVNPLVNARPDIRDSLRLAENGYDGQFMYYMTFDPLLRTFRGDPAQYGFVVDNVPYRFGRIGFSLLTRIIAGDRWQQYPATMIAVILASVFAAAFALAALAEQAGLSPAVGALILIVPGFWRSLFGGLPEPLAVALLLAGVFFCARSQWIVAGACFAGSLLVRETGSVIVLAIAGSTAMAGRRRDAVTLLLVSLVPVALWRIYVGWSLLPAWGISGFFGRAPVIGWPFGGIADLWSAIHQGRYFPGSPSMARAGIAYPILLIGASVLAAALAISTPGAIAIAATVYALLALCLNFEMTWVDVGNAERTTYELFVVLALTTLQIRSYPRPLRVALAVLWCAAGLYFLYGAYDADFLRTTLALPDLP